MTRAIRVAECAGEAGLGADGGERLARELLPVLLAGEEVELDFEGLGPLDKAFLDALVTPLLAELSFDELVTRLVVSQMTVRDLQGLRYVLESTVDPACSLTSRPDKIER